MKTLLENRTARSVATIITIFIFYLISMIYLLVARYDSNYSGFLHISAQRLEINPLIQDAELTEKLILLNDTGYDGQLFYFMAYDPFLTQIEDAEEYKKVVDVPVFRFRRIGFVVATHFFSFGIPEFFPVTMIWLILLSHLIGAIFLVKIAIAYGRDPLWALLYILIPGYSFSIMYGLPESIAGALLLAGFYFTLKDRSIFSIPLFALSLMFRETGLLFIGLVGLFEAFQTRNALSSVKIWSSALPYFLWRLYVTWQLSADTGWAGYFVEPPNLTVPFAGILQLWSRISQGDYPEYIRAAGILLPLLLGAASIIAVFAFRIRKTPQAVALFCYSFLALCLNYEKVWIHVANAERQSFESFICLILVFFSTPIESAGFKKVCAAYFAVLALYDFLMSAADVSFRALLHLAQYLY